MHTLKVALNPRGSTRQKHATEQKPEGSPSRSPEAGPEAHLTSPRKVARKKTASHLEDKRINQRGPPLTAPVEPPEAIRKPPGRSQEDHRKVIREAQ